MKDMAARFLRRVVLVTRWITDEEGREPGEERDPIPGDRWGVEECFEEPHVGVDCEVRAMLYLRLVTIA